MTKLRLFIDAMLQRIVSMLEKITEWSLHIRATKGVRSYHFWIITLLIILGIAIYYVDQTSLAQNPPFNGSFFTGVHDLNRTLFLIPIIYAALVFRIGGSLISSFIFLVAVLPRALLFSPYPDPLLRALLFVIFAALTSLLIATQLNRLERERKIQTALNDAYQKLVEYDHNLRASQEQLIQAERLSSLGQMAGSFAHEINNPLGGVLTYTQLLVKKISSDGILKEDAIKYLAKMEHELIRSTNLIKSLLDFSRQYPTIITEVDINDIVNQALALAGHSAEPQHIQIVKELKPDLPRLMADSSKLKQVCISIIMNSIEAMPKGGKLTVHTSSDDNNLAIQVQDTGHGISSQNISRLFTPFFTTKKEVKGVGLSLAVAHGIIQQHHGEIKVESREGEGTTFTIYLPLHTGELEKQPLLTQ